MKSVALHNLGCKVNGYEMEVMQQSLQEKDYQIVPFDSKADIYIVNTCTVTNMADRKSRQMLHRARRLNPDAVVVAVGCYVQAGREEVIKDQGVDLVIGNNRKKDLVPILEEYLAGRGDKTLQDTTVIDIGSTREYENLQLKRTGGHTRAYIKIQDGCNQFCSYCIIPHVRGRVRSRSREDVLAEVRGLAGSGYREVVLTGIHISSYGVDQGAPGLLSLVKSIHEIDGIERIRVGSLEPRIVTEEFAAELARLPGFCPHFHLSLQSGCDSTLKRMNRRYTAGEYYEKAELLRSVFGNPAITTDVITGFPGETEEEFEATRAFLEKIKFYEMHVFKYSRRKGTPAAVMENQVPDDIKTARSNILLEMGRKFSKEYRGCCIGSEAEVLFEEEKVIDGRTFQVGHTMQYVKVARETDLPLANTIERVRVTGFLTEDILLAEQG
ncbi:MAG: tRNA (N(6)-L-threonylcarbamoyladenosine(37)-C(2))-methylthiotransferase MtaB [Lachnospiraceae bacterium]|nr:tRNA (N(6)-L-threonylcarbamoyladenosine(37)-C(2))-methylthiotransferase MtaB [Lachnospiraceae bacterium]